MVLFAGYGQSCGLNAAIGCILNRLADPSSAKPLASVGKVSGGASQTGVHTGWRSASQKAPDMRANREFCDRSHQSGRSLCMLLTSAPGGKADTADDGSKDDWALAG